MPEYLLHRNGRGRLYGDAEVNSATFISRDSHAKDSAKLRDCQLFNESTAGDRCQVYGGQFYGSHIKGDTVVAGFPTVHDSVLWCSEVSGTPVIIESNLIGNTEVCDSPEIWNTRLVNAIVYGSPTINSPDNEVTGRIHEGHWTRPPKHVKLPWCELSECVDGKLLLDCWCRPVEWWLRFGPDKARKRWSWSDDMIDITIDTIRKQFYNPPHGVYFPLPANAAQTEAPS